MAGYKETPRQKMIAMMYLVLTALLALNVSVEIIDAFVVVNDSMEVTNKNLTQEVEQTYNLFEQQYLLNTEKFSANFEKAKIARELSNKIINYIDSIKYESIARTEKISFDEAKNLPLRNVESKDKYDEVTSFFIGNSQDGTGGEAIVLKNKLEKYKVDIFNLLDDKGREKIKNSLNFNGPYQDAGGTQQNWMMHNFYHTILAANITFLNKLVADVINVESEALNSLFSGVSASDFKFDAVKAKVIPDSRLVFTGENYKSEILVAAVDSKQTIEVVIGGKTYIGQEGYVDYVVPAGGVGPHSYNGIIKVKGPDGEIQQYPFEESYFVMSPSLSIAPIKMNVFYADVDNPVSISVAGIPSSKLIPSINNGSIRRAPNGNDWIVKVQSGGTNKATISVTYSDAGKSKNIGSVEFRVKRVPDPKPSIANVTGGAIQKNVLKAARAIIPNMPDEFDFDLQFEIVSFTFIGVRGGDIVPYMGKGNVLTNEMINFVSNCKNGERIWIEDIIARGPGGNRKLNSINLIVQ